ncbi:hypothetical protein B0T14DRAFT_174236 [Immersiella caudata]|uniref:Uncharacterized protein n=1 Tax=Immersiella caudata TaxID=314043 RepID=A0AA39WXB2_9PEZI|nr:hypothetical protein B0T14DRAFT_174236 [Immersiella caudata]
MCCQWSWPWWPCLSAQPTSGQQLTYQPLFTPGPRVGLARASPIGNEPASTRSGDHFVTAAANTVHLHRAHTYCVAHRHQRPCLIPVSISRPETESRQGQPRPYDNRGLRRQQRNFLGKGNRLF